MGRVQGGAQPSAGGIDFALGLPVLRVVVFIGHDVRLEAVVADVEAGDAEADVIVVLPFGDVQAGQRAVARQEAEGKVEQLVGAEGIVRFACGRGGSAAGGRGEEEEVVIGLGAALDEAHGQAVQLEVAHPHVALQELPQAEPHLERAEGEERVASVGDDTEPFERHCVEALERQAAVADVESVALAGGVEPLSGHVVQQGVAEEVASRRQ